MTHAASHFDTTDLEAYLSAEPDHEVTGVEVLSDKLNLVAAVSTDGSDGAYVLRRPGELRDSYVFTELKQEYRLLERLGETTVPTPDPVLFCDDDSIIGDVFSLSTFLEGETIPWGSDLPERFRNERARERLVDRLVDTLAEIHSLDVEPFEDVCRRRTPRDEIAHATDRLDEATAATGLDLRTLQLVAEWLRENVPSNSRTALVHGDFRPSNVLFTGSDSPEISGVIDWETATLGDPLTELGYVLSDWRDEVDPALPLDDIEAKCPNEDVL